MHRMALLFAREAGVEPDLKACRSWLERYCLVRFSDFIPLERPLTSSRTSKRESQPKRERWARLSVPRFQVNKWRDSKI